jgi:hypothetical protein
VDARPAPTTARLPQMLVFAPSGSTITDTVLFANLAIPAAILAPMDSPQAVPDAAQFTFARSILLQWAPAYVREAITMWVFCFAQTVILNALLALLLPPPALPAISPRITESLPAILLAIAQLAISRLAHQHALLAFIHAISASLSPAPAQPASPIAIF